MADFKKALEGVLKAEGGYVNDPDDTGGETYKGVSRRFNSKWQGWVLVDLLKQKANFPANLDYNDELQKHVADLYEQNYWDRVSGDDIANQEIAESIFDFAVNAGVKTSSRLAQTCVEAKADGVIGANTIIKINNANTDLFIATFALLKISRYIAICEGKPVNRKYFFGWVRRAMEGV